MKLVGLVILFIISILELYYFSTSLIPGGISLLSYLLFHIVSTIGYYLLNLHVIKTEREEKPIFLSFFLPGLGLFIVFVMELFTTIIKPKTEEIDMVTIFEVIDEANEFNFLSEDKVLSYRDNLKYLDSDDKLSLLFDVLEDGTYDKLKILKEGAENENKVVKYYSSVYLSSLANQFENEIFRINDRFSKTENLVDLKNLITVYNSYLSSGLLKEEMYKFFNDKYIEYLKIAIGAEIEVVKYSIRLINAYLSDEQYHVAIELINKSKKTYTHNLEIRILEIKYYVETNNYDMITDCVNDIYKKFSNIPPKETSILKFWSERAA